MYPKQNLEIPVHSGASFRCQPVQDKSHKIRSDLLRQKYRNASAQENTQFI